MKPIVTIASVTVGSVPPRSSAAGPGVEPALCGPGGRAPPRGPDLAPACLGDPADRAAAGADRDDVDNVDAGLERPQLEVLLDADLVVDDDAGVEARAAHVAEQDALDAHPLGQLVRSDRPTGGTRAEQPERVLARLLEADAAAQALEEREPAL